MKYIIWFLLYFFACHHVYSQYYLRGEVRDSRGKLLGGVKINITSRGANPFYTGASGTFGIPLRTPLDSIRFFLDGYETLTALADANRYQVFTMKMLPVTAQQFANRHVSLTTNLSNPQVDITGGAGESYTGIIENGFVKASDYPETGFALHTDKASYSNIRRFINNGMKVPKDAVRIEEMLNYFSLQVPHAVNSRKTFDCTAITTDCPWNAAAKLLFLHITAPKLPLDSLPSSNLVFLVDVSGSMDKPNRLPLLQSAFKLLADNLRDKDSVTIVTYGGGVGIALPATSGSEKQRIINTIDSLTANGDTPGEGALRTAYSMAKKSFIKNGNNRVILATDGDFNVGQSGEKELEDLITGFRQTGIYLTCLGVGMGNYKDSKLETLSKKGNGNFAYLDNPAEAEKVLVTELTQTLFTVADNASLKINFNPATVKEYRLIGYDNKRNTAGSLPLLLEGGEVGSGHATMAIFELLPHGNDSTLLNTTLASLALRYRQPQGGALTEMVFNTRYSPVRFAAADSSIRLAAAIAGFGSVLKESQFTKQLTLEEVRAMAAAAVSRASTRQMELVQLVDKAIHIYRGDKKKARKQQAQKNRPGGGL